MSKFSQLPKEVLCIIFSYVDDKYDVLRLIKVCKQFKILLQPKAYSAIYWHKVTGRTINEKITALKLKTDSPGRYMRELHFDDSTPAGNENVLKRISDEFPLLEYLHPSAIQSGQKYFDKINRLRQELKFLNLKSFYPSFPNDKKYNAYRNCALAYRDTLEVFCCTPQDNVNFPVFLSQLPQLKNLTIHCCQGSSFNWVDSLIESCRYLKSVQFITNSMGRFDRNSLNNTMAIMERREDVKMVVINNGFTANSVNLMSYIKQKFPAFEYLQIYGNPGPFLYQADVIDREYTIPWRMINDNDIRLRRWSRAHPDMLGNCFLQTSNKTNSLTLDYSQLMDDGYCHAFGQYRSTPDSDSVQNGKEQVRLPFFVNHYVTPKLHQLKLIGDYNYALLGYDKMVRDSILNGTWHIDQIFGYEQLVKDSLLFCVNLRRLSLKNMILGGIPGSAPSTSVSHLQVTDCRVDPHFFIGHVKSHSAFR